MLVLGIESSCDDLSMSIVSEGEVLSNATASQTQDHQPFGGVVPEIASRKHLEYLEATLHLALEKAGVRLQDLDGIASTYAPGLVGSLLVGLNFAKALSYGLQKPFYGVHHIEGHLWSAFLENEVLFPFLGLVVSGGHSHLYLAHALGRYELLGKTVDDAAGEAMDKIAKLMGCPYPGGPYIDRMSEQGNPQAYAFTLPRVKEHPLYTSFSGLKTAALNYVQQMPSPLSDICKADLAASFQHAIVRSLSSMVSKALQKYPVRQLAIVGGVACNRALRKAMGELALEHGITCVLPSQKFCMDNGAMIAFVGEKYLKLGKHSPLSLNAKARMPLEEILNV